MKHALVAALCMVAASRVPQAVGAEGTPGPPAEADVILPECPAAALEARALLAALTLELDHDGVRRINRVASQRPDAEATIEVALDCQPDPTQVRLRVRHAPHQETRRAMDIADLPRQLRVRAVALAAAELALATWSHSPRSEVEVATPDVADGNAGAAVEPSHDAPAASKPAPARPATKPPSEKLPRESTTISPPAQAQRRWLGVAAGATARWFPYAVGPSFGGRVAAHSGRLQVGADVLFSYASRFAARPTPALAVAWVAFDAFVREREGWRLSTGPRLATGVGWSPAPTSNQMGPLDGPDPASGTTEPPAETTGGWYLEGALAAELRARTASGWLVGLEVAIGLGWGMAPGRDSLQPSLKPNVGASLLAGRDF